MKDVWVIAKGETGAVRTGRLSDGAGYVDLDGFDSVTVIAQRSLTAAPAIEAAVVRDADQTANKGGFSFTFSEAHAAIAKGTYLLSFKGMNGTNPQYFPLNRRTERMYGRLVVQPPVG